MFRRVTSVVCFISVIRSELVRCHFSEFIKVVNVASFELTVCLCFVVEGWMGWIATRGVAETIP